MDGQRPECVQGQIIKPTQIKSDISQYEGNRTPTCVHICSNIVHEPYYNSQYNTLFDVTLALILGRRMYRHEAYNRTVENIAVSTEYRLFNQNKSGSGKRRWGEKCVHERCFDRELVELKSDADFECHKIFFESSVGLPAGISKCILFSGNIFSASRFRQKQRKAFSTWLHLLTRWNGLGKLISYQQW